MSEGRCACAGKRELEETDVDGRLWHAGWVIGARRKRRKPCRISGCDFWAWACLHVSVSTAALCLRLYLLPPCSRLSFLLLGSSPVVSTARAVSLLPPPSVVYEVF